MSLEEKLNQAKGSVKEGLGKLTGDTKTEAGRAIKFFHSGTQKSDNAEDPFRCSSSVCQKCCLLWRYDETGRRRGDGKRLLKRRKVCDRGRGQWPWNE